MKIDPFRKVKTQQIWEGGWERERESTPEGSGGPLGPRGRRGAGQGGGAGVDEPLKAVAARAPRSPLGRRRARRRGGGVATAWSRGGPSGRWHGRRGGLGGGDGAGGEELLGRWGDAQRGDPSMRRRACRSVAAGLAMASFISWCGTHHTVAWGENVSLIFLGCAAGAILSVDLGRLSRAGRSPVGWTASSGVMGVFLTVSFFPVGFYEPTRIFWLSHVGLRQPTEVLLNFWRFWQNRKEIKKPTGKSCGLVVFGRTKRCRVTISAVLPRRGLCSDRASASAACTYVQLLTEFWHRISPSRRCYATTLPTRDWCHLGFSLLFLFYYV